MSDNPIREAMRRKPETIIIGEVRSLSRKKARKLAYLYRGSKRGQWYKRYLEGDTKEFLVQNNRLIRNRLMNIGSGHAVMETYHSAGVATLLKKRLAEIENSKPALSIVSPVELKFGN